VKGVTPNSFSVAASAGLRGSPSYLPCIFPGLGADGSRFLLDDPVQHVDDYRALNLVEVLAAVRRSGRQVVVAVEDAALADVLCRRLRSSQTEAGRRYDLNHAVDGSARFEAVLDILPLPLEACQSQSLHEGGSTRPTLRPDCYCETSLTGYYRSGGFWIDA